VRQWRSIDERYARDLARGGAGERLYPLTRDRAKPAVTFGGIYRIIDISLSNCVNSGLRRVYILTQYRRFRSIARSRRLEHLRPRNRRVHRDSAPHEAGQRELVHGDGDAVYQNIYSIGSEQPKYVIILSGDHIYKMNYERNAQQHQDAAPSHVAT